MTIVADAYTYVIGVDTHAATHHYAIIETRSGALIAHAQFPTHPKGLHRASDWIDRRTLASTGGDLGQVLLSIEGTGSYGGPLAQLLSKHGFRVTDAPSPKRERGSGKNDHIDALAAARGILHKHPQRLAQTKTEAGTAALRTLLTRAPVDNQRTHQVRQRPERPLARHRPRPRCPHQGQPGHHHHDRGLAPPEQGRSRPGHRPPRSDSPGHPDPGTDTGRQTEPAGPGTDRERHCARPAGSLGVGPINAATVLTAWDAPDRFHSEAAFARLGGVCPLRGLLRQSAGESARVLCRYFVGAGSRVRAS